MTDKEVKENKEGDDQETETGLNALKKDFAKKYAEKVVTEMGTSSSGLGSLVAEMMGDDMQGYVADYLYNEGFFDTIADNLTGGIVAKMGISTDTMGKLADFRKGLTDAKDAIALQALATKAGLTASTTTPETTAVVATFDAFSAEKQAEEVVAKAKIEGDKTTKHTTWQKFVLAALQGVGCYKKDTSVEIKNVKDDDIETYLTERTEGKDITIGDLVQMEDNDVGFVQSRTPSTGDITELVLQTKDGEVTITDADKIEELTGYQVAYTPMYTATKASTTGA